MKINIGASDPLALKSLREKKAKTKVMKENLKIKNDKTIHLFEKEKKST